MRIRSAALLLALLAAPLPAGARVVDGIIAVVNDEPITFSEFRDQVAESLGIPAGEADAWLREERSRERILQGIASLVDSVLVRQELKRLGQGVEEKEIDRAVESVRRNNKLSEEELAAALARDGTTLGAYRRRVRWQLERGAIVRARKLKDVTVTEAEAREFYRANAERFLSGAEVRIETLTLPFPPGGPGPDLFARLRIEVEQADERVRAGETLEEAARALREAVPDATLFASDFVREEELVPEVRREVAKLSTGRVSPPFATEAGLHLVAVRGRRGGTPVDFALVREALTVEIVDRRSEKAFVDIVAELKKAATIDVRL